MAFRRALSVLVFFSNTSLVRADLSHGRTHFRRWYLQYRSALEGIMKGSCSAEYNEYLTNPVLPPGCDSCYMQSMLNCLLDNLSEFQKNQMGAAAILLGLLPTIISQVGSSPIETGLLAIHRPLLAMVISLSTPGISAESMRAFDSDAVRAILRKPTSALSWRVFLHLRKEDANDGKNDTAISLRSRVLTVAVCQYLVAFAAAANIGHVSWEVTVSAVMAMNPATLYLPMLYVVLAWVVHLIGFVTVFFRVRKWSSDVARKTKSELPQTMRDLLRNATRPSRYHEYDEKNPRILEVKAEKLIMWVLIWATRIASVSLYVFGTLMFSGIMFVGPLDALTIVVRYLASAIVCRMIMVYEMIGISRQVVVKDEEPPIKHTSPETENPKAINDERRAVALRKPDSAEKLQTHDVANFTKSSVNTRSTGIEQQGDLESRLSH